MYQWTSKNWLIIVFWLICKWLMLIPSRTWCKVSIWPIAVQVMEGGKIYTVIWMGGARARMAYVNRHRWRWACGGKARCGHNAGRAAARAMGQSDMAHWAERGGAPHAVCTTHTMRAIAFWTPRERASIPRCCALLCTAREGGLTPGLRLVVASGWLPVSTSWPPRTRWASAARYAR